MKKHITKGVICLGLLFLVGGAKAQFSYANQWNLNIGAGWTPSKGYAIQLGTEKVFGLSASSIQMKLNYGAIPAKIENHIFTFDRYSLAINYAFSFDKLMPSKWLFINIVGGGVVGYEDIPKRVANYTIHNQNQWLGGINASIVAEMPIVKKIHFYIEPKVTYMINSNVKNVDFTILGGFKFYL